MGAGSIDSHRLRHHARDRMPARFAFGSGPSIALDVEKLKSCHAFDVSAATPQKQLQPPPPKHKHSDRLCLSDLRSNKRGQRGSPSGLQKPPQSHPKSAPPFRSSPEGKRAFWRPAGASSAISAKSPRPWGPSSLAGLLGPFLSFLGPMVDFWKQAPDDGFNNVQR